MGRIRSSRCQTLLFFPTRVLVGSRASNARVDALSHEFARRTTLCEMHVRFTLSIASHEPRIQRVDTVHHGYHDHRKIIILHPSLTEIPPPSSQQPPKAPESKAAKAAKAMAGGKGKKKKWSKGKNKEKANNQVLFEQSTYDKLMAEVPKYKMITVSILTDRLRITCSLARKAIAILIAKGMIKPVTMHSKQQIYTKTAADDEA